MNTPKDWLTKDQLQYVRDLLGNDDTEYNKTVRLKNYLAGFRAELEKKDAMPEYLAYLLIHLHNEGKL